MTTPQEGAIKFRLRFAKAPPFPSELLRTLNAWRWMMYRAGLIGQDSERYDGYAYGNISMRNPATEAETAPDGAFLISASQTGGLPDLTPREYALVELCRPEENLVVARGPMPPSSESLTHGAVYAADAAVQCVIHGHDPHLWRAAEALGLPVTDEAIPYGSPEMAAAVSDLVRSGRAGSSGVFAMGGHEDGIVAYGRTAREAGLAVLGAVVEARTLVGATPPE